MSNIFLLYYGFAYIENNANIGGAIRVGMECELLIETSRFSQNNATLGGCLYGDSSSTRDHGSIFVENRAIESGGCMYMDSSTLKLFSTMLYRNKAKKGGGIYASTRTFLQMQETTISSNSASDNAGGLALMDDSRLLCFSCKFVNNRAIRGGGLYIQSHATQLVLARLQDSKLELNDALTYGGNSSELEYILVRRDVS